MCLFEGNAGDGPVHGARAPHRRYHDDNGLSIFRSVRLLFGWMIHRVVRFALHAGIRQRAFSPPADPKGIHFAPRSKPPYVVSLVVGRKRSAAFTPLPRRLFPATFRKRPSVAEVRTAKRPKGGPLGRSWSGR